MSKQVILESVPFVAASNTLNFVDVPRFDKRSLIAVVNQTTKQIMYAPAAGAGFGGTWSGDTLTLDCSTAGMANGDLLQIQYHDPILAGNSPNGLFDNFDTLDTTKWTLTKASGDIVLAEGNIAGSTYLHMSLDPLTENTETTLVTNDKFEMPMRIGIAASVPFASTVNEVIFRAFAGSETAYTPVAITSYSQTTTTMTITTTTAHGLAIGDRISIAGIADSRANYGNAVVATVTSSTVFTFTAGSGGNIPSLTISGGAGGRVHRRSELGYAMDGFSAVIENSLLTQISAHVKSGDKKAFHGGTFAGNQAITVVDSFGFSQTVAADGAYNFVPLSVQEMIITPEFVEILGRAADSTTAGYTARFRKDSGVPTPDKTYQFGVTIKNPPSLPRPVAKIISCSKAGSTTTTVTHDGAATFTTGDFVQLYGRRDFATNFPNLSTATQIASIISGTQFTIVDGPSVTATTYGGAVLKVNGGTGQPGVFTPSIQNAVRGADGLLILTGSATWAGGGLIGDFVNVYGCRDNATGADVGVDGAYRIRGINTTTLTLESIGGTGSGVVTSIACGGFVVRRHGIRLRNIRIAEYSRHLVESVGGMNKGDVASSAPVAVVAALPTGANTIGTVTLGANQSVNIAQIAGITPLNHSPNGAASGKALTVGIAGPISNTDYSAQAWAAASGNGATISEVNGLGASATFDVQLTAWTAGASTGLDIFLQESPDNGTTFYDIWQCEALTGVGRCRIPAIPINGRRRMRWVNRGGAATTATVTVTAMEVSIAVPKRFQFFDRTASVGSGTAASGTNSAAYHIDFPSPSSLTVAVQTGTATAPASWKVQMSMDGANWYDASAAVSCLASSMTLLPITSGVTGRFIRVQCTLTGTAALVTALHIGGAE